MRFFVGVGIGTNPIPYDLLAEQIPASIRGRILMTSSIFWAIGTLYTVGAAWITLPVWSWRSLAVACALPPLAVAIALLFVLNESPRWLLEEGRREEAAAVLRQLAKRNDKAEDKAVDAAISKVAEGGDDASVSRGFDVGAAWRNFLSLFDERRFLMTAAVWIVWFAFGLLYGLCGNQTSGAPRHRRDVVLINSPLVDSTGTTASPYWLLDLTTLMMTTTNSSVASSFGRSLPSSRVSWLARFSCSRP